MLQYFRLVGLALLLSVGVGSVGQAASFDCNKATTETEIAICSDPELSALDELMGALYQQSLRANDWNSDSAMEDLTLKRSQLDWINQRDGSCVGDANCIRDFYINRVIYLMEYTSRPQYSWEAFETEYIRLRDCCGRKSKYIEEEVLELLNFLPFLDQSTDIRHFSTSFNVLWDEGKVRSVSLLFLSKDNPNLISAHTKGIYNDNPVTLLISVEDRNGNRKNSDLFNVKPLPMETEVSIWDRGFKIHTFFTKGQRSDTYQFLNFNSPPELLASDGY
jgi:uncharacterized protein